MIRPAVVLLLLTASATAAEPQTMTIHPSSLRLTALILRGEYAIMALDITKARRLLAEPAEAGNMAAALRMAQTYDPVWLVRNGVMPWEEFADAEVSYAWYKRAAEAGDTSPDNRFVATRGADEAAPAAESAPAPIAPSPAPAPSLATRPISDHPRTAPGPR